MKEILTNKLRLYKTAIGFYQGPYLADMDYPWVIPDRQKFHETGDQEHA